MRSSTMPPGQAMSAQDSALELVAQQIAVISQKANEVDTLKITIEIMKNKIQRLEEVASLTPPQPTLPHQPTRETAALATQSPHTTIPYHTAPVTISHTTPNQPSTSQASYSFAHLVANNPEISRRPEPLPSQSSGWATVNAGVKRTHSNGMESPHETSKHIPGSPKRPRLTTVEPSITHETPLGQADIDSPETRTQVHTLTQPSRYSIPESVLASQSQHSVYIPYGTQDGPSEDSWRPESQRIIEHRPRGRGRGGGPGSRGGRGRKSMPAQIHTLGTSEWQKDDWQSNLDGYYDHVARSGRGIARRGNGGGGTRGGYPPNDRAVSLGLQGVSAGMGLESPSDLYSHTKKTRTKPIRNADGVLIRKDGRPDMRSQSSAANLRKVHARKDGDPNQSPSRSTPTNLHYSDSAGAPDTPSPSSFGLDHSVSASIHKKHNAIMDKIFPSGVDQSRRQHDYSRQVFEEDPDHTVHPRTQNHHQSTRSPPRIKKELLEQNRIMNLQSPEDEDEEDVDMDRTDDHADDEGQAPGEQSDNSARAYHGAQRQEALAQNPSSHMGSQAVPETQAVDKLKLDVTSIEAS
ncbi:hypothetical protein N0V83_003906 [Neocucurbitaria cava]|uniref:Uncharacterized protein n=1 Tax=Neocucurbitaria cava TaxID=798079 RepID=A0A9W8YA45_9PLEO|nr:hypothetical protein N0V83_003906 [Neocucurbitaria cava]